MLASITFMFIYFTRVFFIVAAIISTIVREVNAGHITTKDQATERKESLLKSMGSRVSASIVVKPGCSSISSFGSRGSAALVVEVAMCCCS